MGAHHFKFHLIPLGLTRGRDAEGEPVDCLLLEHAITEATLAAFRALLPRVEGWDGCEELCSGRAWGSDIRIWREDDGRISDIGVRFAPGADGALGLLEGVLAVIRQAGCAITLDGTTEVYPAELEVVLPVVRGHRSVRFLSDPAGVLREIRKENKEDSAP